MAPQIAFFDMDHTLIDNDCDVSWKHFLVEEGLADPSEDAEEDRFYQSYLRGELNVAEFLEFQLSQFQDRTPAEMAPLCLAHARRWPLPRVYPQAVEAVEQHRSAGAAVLMLTATNEAIARPVAEHFGFDELLATRLEVGGGRYTGRIVPPYCYGEAKVTAAQAACARRGWALSGAAYYGDSYADIPLLGAVGHPVAVNPGERLRRAAEAGGWPIAQWRRSPGGE